MSLTFFITFAPPLLILAFILWSDKCPEPADLCITTFVIGCLLCIPAGYLNSFFIYENDAAFLAGLTEEPLKFAAIYFFIRKKAAFNEPMDAIVYGTLISLGFATLENYDYVYYWASENAIDAQAVAFVRAFSAIPMHACCGVIMGYYFGLYMFKKRNNENLFKAILIPIVFHAVYNYSTSLGFLAMFIVLAVMIGFAIKLHRKFVYEQSQNEC